MAKLHDNTLRLAENLLSGSKFGSAASRRAVSSAYYALFQRLSSLCASRLAGNDAWTDEYRRLYRALDHKHVRSSLNRSGYRTDLGARFEQLQDVRHWADYSIEPHPDPELSKSGKRFSADDAQVHINTAREAIHFVDALDSPGQLKLAILLVARDR
jgi:hypothetical protein